jgi:hypothetical protein
MNPLPDNDSTIQPQEATEAPVKLYSHDVEKALLGAILMDGVYFERAKELNLEDFHDHRHQWIWSAMVRRDEAGAYIDKDQVFEQLNQDGKLNEVGGFSYLMELEEKADCFNVEPNQAILKDYTSRRKVFLLGKRVVNQALKGAIDYQKLSDDIKSLEKEGAGDVSILDNPRFVIKTAVDIMKPLDPVKWVIDQVATEGSLTIWFGKWGSKKTSSLIDAAVKVAMGMKFIDFQTIQSKVLYIDEENGEDILRRRLQDALRGSFGGEDVPIEYVCFPNFNLTKPGEAFLLEALINERGAKFVVVDSLVDIMAGADENLVKEAIPIIKSLRLVAVRTGAAIQLLHHSNNLGDIRGSSGTPGEVDSVIKIISKDGSNHIDFEILKTRRGKSFKFAAHANWNESQFWLSPAEPRESVKSYNKSQEYVLRILKERGALKLSEVEGCADTCSSAAARAAVFSLAKSGEIYRTNPGEYGRGIEAIYAIKENPQG